MNELPLSINEVYIITNLLLLSVLTLSNPVPKPHSKRMLVNYSGIIISLTSFAINVGLKVKVEKKRKEQQDPDVLLME